MYRKNGNAPITQNTHTTAMILLIVVGKQSRIPPPANLFIWRGRNAVQNPTEWAAVTGIPFDLSILGTCGTICIPVVAIALSILHIAISLSSIMANRSHIQIICMESDWNKIMEAAKGKLEKSAEAIRRL